MRRANPKPRRKTGRTDAYGKTYSESEAFDYMCKWYGATVSHRIVRA